MQIHKLITSDNFAIRRTRTTLTNRLHFRSRDSNSKQSERPMRSALWVLRPRMQEAKEITRMDEQVSTTSLQRTRTLRVVRGGGPPSQMAPILISWPDHPARAFRVIKMVAVTQRQAIGLISKINQWSESITARCMVALLNNSMPSQLRNGKSWKQVAEISFHVRRLLNYLLEI